MDLRTYFFKLPIVEREALALEAGTKWVYVSQLIRNHRRPSIELAKKLHHVSNGQIALASLRPDVWDARVPQNATNLGA